jgi:hypothetical protein
MAVANVLLGGCRDLGIFSSQSIGWLLKQTAADHCHVTEHPNVRVHL